MRAGRCLKMQLVGLLVPSAPNSACSLRRKWHCRLESQKFKVAMAEDAGLDSLGVGEELVGEQGGQVCSGICSWQSQLALAGDQFKAQVRTTLFYELEGSRGTLQVPS